MEENSEKTAQVSKEKKEEAKQEDQSLKEVMFPFDEALGNHIERLLGTRHGIKELQMNLFTVSCLVMIATRETEIESFPYLPPQRYTHEKLLEEMAEISIQPVEGLESGIHDMIEKGYIEVTDDGRFFAKEPTISMAQLIDRIFPQMPGLNLVAYLGQMIDEATAGRKEIETAVSQFNQMLEMHGIPIKKATGQSGSSKKLYPHLKASQTPLQKISKKHLVTDSRPKDIFSQLQTRTYSTPPIKATVPGIDTDQTNTAINESENPLSGESPETGQSFDPLSEMEDQSPEMPFEHQEKIADDRPETVYTDDEYGISSQPSSDSLPDVPGGETAAIQPLEDSILSREGDKNAVSFEKTIYTDDEDIEKKIAAFEEQLGMTCPLCGTAGIRANETARGKLYYHCTNDECNFISWGKPFYVACPQCSNPFLVEGSNSAGKAILKCPRATCHHWQNFPWDEVDDISEDQQESSKAPVVKQKQRRRVKRRRKVVRRKR